MDLSEAEPLVTLLESEVELGSELRREIVKDLAGHLFDNPTSLIQRIENVETPADEITKLGKQLIAVYHSKYSETRVADALLEDRVLDRVAARLPKHALGKVMWAVVAVQLVLLGVSVPVFGVQISEVLKTKQEAVQAVSTAKASADQAKITTEDYKREIDHELNNTLVMKADAVAQARDQIVAQGVASLDIAGLQTRIARSADQKVEETLAKPRENITKVSQRVSFLEAQTGGLTGKLKRLDDAQKRVDQLEAQSEDLGKAITGQRAIMADTVKAQIFWSAYQLSGGATLATFLLAVVATLLSFSATFMSWLTHQKVKKSGAPHK